MKRTVIKRFTIALGILAVVAVLCGQLFQNQAAEKRNVKAATEQSDSEQQEFLSLSSTSLPSSAHVELNRDVFFLFETLLSENDTDEIKSLEVVPLRNLFDFLIGHFISPNAP